MSEDKELNNQMTPENNEPLAIMSDEEFKEFINSYFDLFNESDLSEENKKVKRLIGDSKQIDVLKIYLKQIGQYDILTPEEEKQVAKKAKEGDQQAIDILVTSNLRYVVNVARKYIGFPHELKLLDLIQEGNIGLMDAVEDFDYTKGVRFVAFATYRIQKAITEAINKTGRTIKYSDRMQSQIRTIKTAEQLLAQKLGRDPTDQEIADSLEGMSPKMTAERVRSIKLMSRPIQSIDDTIEGEDSEMKIDIAAPQPEPEQEIDDEVKNALAAALKVLNPREQSIIRMKIGTDGKPGMTSVEISKELGVSVERIDQIVQGALDLINKEFTGDDSFEESDKVEI